MSTMIKNLSIGRRLALIMCFAFVMIIITETTGLVNSRRLANEINLGYEAITLPLKAIANARGEFNAMRTALHDLAFDFNTDEQNRRFTAEILRNLSNFEDNIILYKEILDIYGTNAPYEQEAVDYLYGMLLPLREYVEHIIPVAQRTGFEADVVRILRGGFHDAAEDISLELMLLTDILEAQSNDANLRAEAQFRDTVILFAVVLAVSMIILTLGTLVFARSIIKPLREITDTALDLSNGNLDTADIGFHSKNELGILADSFRHMIHGLKARELMISGITYASQIQRSLLPADSVFAEAFADHSVIWDPKDIVGGDIYWIKNFDGGAILCVCDCTGHGTPGALLTMLVVSTFETSVNETNYMDTAAVIWELEKRLTATLKVDADSDVKDGCDLAVVFIANDGTVSISSGNTNVFVCDGQKVSRLRGQRIRVGEGSVKGKDKIKVTTVPADPANKFYIASDGLYEQVGGEENIPFGYDIIKEIILENHAETQSVISEKIWRAFEAYRGDNARRDDLELITFIPKNGKEGTN
ncbi:MAG: HAMP domain-containing protein [Defluviitaleaceae bacterium]|nr:HAMP domain-containing protein [Defluviitaleaceae bacterium]MCL2835433.1 HAMP domain-containing protein [Defluviitaleaceae bacterium]